MPWCVSKSHTNCVRVRARVRDRVRVRVSVRVSVRDRVRVVTSRSLRRTATRSGPCVHASMRPCACACACPCACARLHVRTRTPRACVYAYVSIYLGPGLAHHRREGRLVASGRRLAAESRSVEHICRAACRAAHQPPIHPPPIWVRVRVPPSLTLTLSLTLSVLGYPIPEQPKVPNKPQPKGPGRAYCAIGRVGGGALTLRSVRSTRWSLDRRASSTVAKWS